MGGSPRKAILFEGPPGTGKTYMAKAMAAEAGVPFLFVSSSAFQSMFYGQTNRKIRAYFKALRRHARREGGAIGFIEELDAIGAARGTGPRHGEGVPGVVNELLDPTPVLRADTRRRCGSRARSSTPSTPGCPPTGACRKPTHVPANILVIGATNRAADLDPALLRPGRFDRNIYFGLPSRSGRRDIIDYYLGKKAHEAELDDPARRETLAALTAGYSPVMIEHLMDESLVWALRRGADRLSWNDLQHAKMTEEIGLAQPVEYTEAERRTIATHEAGHATVAWLVGKGRKLEVLTIVKRKDALGLLSHSEEEERFTKTKSEVRALIDIAFGGMVAEELFFGEASTGVAGDLQAATLNACQMVGLLGMGTTLVSSAAMEYPAGGIVSKVLSTDSGRAEVEAPAGRGQGVGDPDARGAPQRGRGPAGRPARPRGADRRRHPRGDQELPARSGRRDPPTRSGQWKQAHRPRPRRSPRLSRSRSTVRYSGRARSSSAVASAPLGAVAAPAPEDHLERLDGHPVALGPGQGETGHAPGLDVEGQPASLAHQVVVVRSHLGVVAGGAVGQSDLADLTHVGQLVEGVVDGGQTDLGHHPPGGGVDLLGAQVDVLALEGAEDGPALGGDPPPPGLEPVGQRDGRRGGHAVSGGGRHLSPAVLSPRGRAARRTRRGRRPG